MSSRFIILVVFFGTSLPICFARPFYGILLWTVVAFLNPQSFIWSGSDVFPWALAVALPTLAGFVMFETGWGRLKSPEVLLICFLWIWFTFTSFISTNTPMFVHHSRDTWERWQLVSKVLLMTAVTIGTTKTFAQLRWLVLVIAGCFGLFLLKSLPFMILTQGGSRLYGPENSMIADNNDFGLALDMTLPFFFCLAQTEANRWAKRLFGFLFVVAIPAVFFTYSRGALVGLIVVMGAMFVGMKRKLLLVPVIIVGIFVALLFAPQAWKDRMNPTREGAVIDPSALERLNAWTFCWNLALDFPITGGGFATFTPELFDRYAPNTRDVHGPHSIYFGVLAEHGFIGSFAYLTLVGICFVSVRRLAKLGRYYDVPLAVGYANMLRFSLVGFLVAGAFLGRAYFDYFFTIVACIVILKRLCLAEWASVLKTDFIQMEVAQ